MWQRLAVLVGLMLGAVGARADDVLGEVEVAGHRVPVFALATVQGDSADAAVLAAAPVLRALAEHEGFEGGGMVCQDGAGQFGVVLQTARSQINMPITTLCPVGMKPTGESVHSHPARPFVVTNDIDALFSGRGHRAGESVTAEGAFFSPADFAAPGYVVTPERVLYQHGRREVRAVH